MPAGFHIDDGFISPLDLVEIGLVSAEEAAELHAVEMANAAARRRSPHPPAPRQPEDPDVRVPQSRPPHVRRTARRVSRR